jgi:hypothetical protein
MVTCTLISHTPSPKHTRARARAFARMDVHPHGVEICFFNFSLTDLDLVCFPVFGAASNSSPCVVWASLLGIWTHIRVVLLAVLPGQQSSLPLKKSSVSLNIHIVKGFKLDHVDHHD